MLPDLLAATAKTKTKQKKAYVARNYYLSARWRVLSRETQSKTKNCLTLNTIPHAKKNYFVVSQGLKHNFRNSLKEKVCAGQLRE